jgi:hypothetical protein
MKQRSALYPPLLSYYKLRTLLMTILYCTIIFFGNT